MAKIKNYTQTIQQVYIALLGRPAEPDAVTDWNSLLNNKVKIQSLVDSLGGTQEFADVHGAQSNQSFVNSIFQTCFGRAATQKELDKWSNKLVGGMDQEDVAWKIAKKGSSDDKQVMLNKITAASLWTAQIDTPSEIAVYSGDPAFDNARDWLADITTTVPGVSEIAADIAALLNQAPVAINDASAATEAGPVVSGTVASNDSDVNGDALTFAAATGQGPVAGLTFNADGSFTFDPSDAAYNGLAAGETQNVTFNYKVTDVLGATDTATLTIVVTGTNDAPVAVADANAATEGGAVVNGTVATNDSDVDGDSLSYAAAAGQGAVAGLTFNANGTYSFNPANAAYDELAAGEIQVVTFNYTVSDGNGGSADSTLTITVTGTNDAPVASDVQIAGQEDVQVIGQVFATDVDGDALTFSADNAVHGSINMSSDGTYTFTPDADYAGVASFDYTVDDGNGGSVTRTVTITLADQPDILTAGIDSFTLSNPNFVEEVIGFNNNLNAGDEVTGDASDKVILSLDGDLSNPDFAAFEFTEIGTFQVTNDSGQAVTFDMSSSEGVDTLVSENSTADLRFNYANMNADGADADAMDEVNLQVLNLTEGVNITLDVRNDDAADENDELNLLVTDSDDDGLDADTINVTAAGTGVPDPDTDAGIEVVNLATTGSTGEVRINDLNTPGATTLNIDTAVNLTIGDTNDDLSFPGPFENALSATISLVEAGTSTGNIALSTEDNDVSATVNMGSGDDTIVTGDGGDVINGNAGDDVLAAGEGNNTVNGGADNDTITAGAGNDSLNGGTGNDNITAGNGNNTVDGAAGNDTITVGNGSDYVLGSEGEDLIDITAGGGDTVFAGSENDTVNAGATLGSDFILVNLNTPSEFESRAGGLPRTDLDGGTGIDVLNATTDSGDVNDLDDITGFETINLNAGDWNITVTDRSDFDEDASSANVNGVGAHFTYINAFSANSLVFEGNTTSQFGDDFLTQTVHIDGSNVGADSIVTGLGNDSVEGNGGNDTIETTFGEDVVEGNAGQDSILSGDGNDTVFGGSQEDYIDAGAGNDVISGDDGQWWWTGFNDTIVAGTGNDTVNFAQGDDSIDLGADDDLLIVNDAQLDSNDALVAGGTGTDTIQLNNGTWWSGVADAVFGSEVSGIQTLLINDNTSWWWGGNVTVTFEGAGDNYDNLEPGGAVDRSVLTIDGSALDGPWWWNLDGEKLTVDTSALDGDGDAIDEDFNIIGGAGLDLFNFGNNLDAGDTVTGGVGAESDTVQTDGTVVDAAFTNVSNVEVLQLTTDGADDDNVTLAAQAQEAGIRTVNGSDDNDVVDASGYTVGLRVNGNAGDDDITTGTGNDTVDMGISDLTGDTVAAGAGDDIIEVSGNTGLGNTELTNLDVIDGGLGDDQIRLMNMTADGEVEAFVDLDNVTNVENYVIDGSGDRTGGVDADQNVLSFTGGNIGSVQTIAIDATALTDADDSFEVVLEVGLTDPDYWFTIQGSSTTDILRKENLGTDNNITFNGGAGDDSYYVNGDDLGSNDAFDGGSAITFDRIVSTGGTFQDDAFENIANVEELTAENVAIDAILGNTAAASGLQRIVDNGANNDTIVVDAAFLTANPVDLNVFLTGGNDSFTWFNDVVGQAVVNFNASAASITVADTLVGGATADDIFYLTADNGTADLTNVSGVETYVVVEGTGGADDANIGLTFADSSFVGVVDNTITIDGTALNDVDINGNALPEGAMTVNAGTITTGAFNISAGVGHDDITTGGGNDTIDVGQGNDTVDSGAGNDVITNTDGDNSVTAGTGNDSVTLGAGNNWVDAGAGNDSVTVGNGNNTIFGGIGDDTIALGTGSNSVEAGDGVDTVTIAAGTGSNYIDLGADNDALTLTGGTAGANTILGGGDDDTITINTNAGVFTTVIGGAGTDAITLGAGSDSIRYDAVADSSFDTRDTVTGFNAGGGDEILLSMALLSGTATSFDFIREATDFEDASLLIGNTAMGNGIAEIVFNRETNRLLVDVNDDGVFNGDDLAINFDGSTGTFDDTDFTYIVAPVAMNDAFVTNEDVAIVGANVLANDSGLTDVPITVTFDFSGVLNGVVVDNLDGTFDYTPNANWSGVENFSYTVTDLQGDFDTATGTITVNAVNDAPTLALSATDPTATTLTLSASDADTGAVLNLTVPINGVSALSNGVDTAFTMQQQVAVAAVNDLTVSDGTAQTAANVILAQGSGGADTISAPGAGDTAVYYGFGGDDDITGGDQADFLFGGDGNDSVTGGAGADNISGSTGLDVFIIASETDSTAASMDMISDFVALDDLIDLSATGVFGGNFSNGGSAYADLAAVLTDAHTWFSTGGVMGGVFVGGTATDTWVVADTNDNLAYDAATDTVIQLSGIDSTGITAANFLP